MPKIIKTHLSSPTVLSGSERLWTYNGLDCCVTFEVFEALEGQLDNQTRSTYEFSKALQAPVLDMRLRGIAIDIAERDRLLGMSRDSGERPDGGLPQSCGTQMAPDGGSATSGPRRCPL